MSLLEAFPMPQLSAEAYAGLMPFLTLGVGATIALVLSATSRGRVLGMLTTLATILISALQLRVFPAATVEIGGVLSVDALTHVLFLMLHLAALFGVLLLSSQDKRENLPAEVYPLVGYALAGMGLLVSSRHLLFQFIALEILSLAIYVLVAVRRTRPASAEAGMKYFILGGLASALFLYGAALLFGATSTFDVREMATATPNMLKVAGFLLVTVGLLFKVGAFPFHGWVPDVYEGASLPVTGFMAAAVKIAAFFALIPVCQAALQDPMAKFPLTVLLAVSAGLTMAYGNVAALAQRGIKRLLAYSSIAHTGYLIVGVLAGGDSAPVGLYLLFYILSAMGAFACLQALIPDRDDAPIDALAGAGLARPVVAAMFTLFLFGMAGLPLTAGFIGKYLVFAAGVNAGLVPLVVVAVLTSVAGVYYYLRVVVTMYMKTAPAKTAAVPWQAGTAVVMGLCALFTLNWGLRPETVVKWFHSLW